MTADVPGLVHCTDLPSLSNNGTFSVELRPLGIKRKPVTIAELRAALVSLLTALTHLHANGYVHRDIRWDNILVDRQVRKRSSG